MIQLTILVSSNERTEVKQALGDLGMVANIPFDFQLFTERGSVPCERKKIPDDLMASIGDGRLAKECAAMRQESEFRVVILEGRFSYTSDDRLRIGNRPSRWTRKAVRNIIRSIKYVEGCDIEYSDNILDTVEVLKELQAYFDKDKHLSLRIRPRFESSWLVPVYEERFIYWLQGCGFGISVVRARAISQVFKTPMEVGQAYVDGTLAEKLVSIPGIGKTLAKGFVEFWEGGL